MTENPEDSFVTGNFIKCCDNFLKNNIDKFYNYAKHQETFRLQLIATLDEYKNYQTWLESAYVDIISMKSERGELLFGNDNVLEFLHIMNDLKTQRLKFVETVNEYKNLKRTVDVVNKDIVSLKSEYNDFKRSGDRLSKQDLASELDKNGPENKLRLKFNDTINCCERLNCSLDIAFKRIKTLNEKHDGLVERYRVLFENETVQEFLEYAKRQSKVRLKITESTDEGERPQSSQHPVIDPTLSLKSQLTETLRKLNSEKLRREVIENERNSLDKLSERLCRLLLKFQRSEVNEESTMINKSNRKPAKEKNASSDNSDTVVDSTSSSILEISTSKSKKDLKRSSQSEIICLTEDAYEPVAIKLERTGSLEVSNPNLNDNDEELTVIKEEKAVAFPIISTSSVASTSTVSCSNAKKTGVSKKKCDTTTLSSEANEGNKSSSRKDVTSRRQLRKRKKKPHSKIKPSKPSKPAKKICLGNQIEEHETFNCHKCGKSFIVKPNERKPQNCPFCDIIPAYIRVISKSPKSAVGTFAAPHQSTSPVSNLPKQREVLS